MIKRFSIECHKTKPKVITLANHYRDVQFNKPIKTDVKRRKTSADKTERVMIGSGFTTSLDDHDKVARVL